MAFVSWTIQPGPGRNGRGSIALPIDPVGDSAVLPPESAAWVRIAVHTEPVTILRLACHGTSHAECEPGKLDAGDDHVWEIQDGAYQVELDYECDAPFAVLISTLEP